MSLLKLTSAQLRQAADLKEQIEALQNELNALHGTSAAATDAPLGRAKRAISAAGLAKIRAGQKKRWAKARKWAAPAPSPPNPAGGVREK